MIYNENTARKLKHVFDCIFYRLSLYKSHILCYYICKTMRRVREGIPGLGRHDMIAFFIMYFWRINIDGKG